MSHNVVDTLVYISWNIQGKSLFKFGAWSELTFCAPDVLLLQEVGGFGDLQAIAGSVPGPLKEVRLGSEFHAGLGGYTILGSSTTSSYLAQVIAVHEDYLDHVIDTYQGDRFIAARVMTKAGVKVWLTSVHFPHSDNDMEQFERACVELTQFLRGRFRDNVVLAGDWNASVGGHRALLLDATLSSLQYVPYRPGVPTRFGPCSSTEFDYFFVSPSYHHLIRVGSIAAVVDNPQARRELGSDHSAVALHFDIKRRHKHRRYRKRNKCGSYMVASDKLAEYVATGCFHLQDMNVTQQWERFLAVSNEVLVRTPTLKYCDPVEIKQLCKQRQVTQDPEIRASIARVILSKRCEAKRSWWRDLEERASKGDAAAIRYIRQRTKAPASSAAFVRESGGREGAAQAVRERMSSLFQASDPQEVSESVNTVVEQLLTKGSQYFHNPITTQEVLDAVFKVKLGRSSGLSGISGEFYKALVQHQDGLEALRTHFDLLLRTGDKPLDYQQSYVCLIPKLQAVAKAADLRPINLLETVHKIYTTILGHRISAPWQFPRHQLGGSKGCQVLDALFCTASYFDKESVMKRYSLWFNTDIEAAFDSVSHIAIAKYLQDKTPEHLSLEAARLLQLSTDMVLHFEYAGEQFSIKQTRGIPQGGTHSSLLFSVLLGSLLDELARKWAADGECNLHGVFLWSYIDDLLVCFRDWPQALRLTEQLQLALSTLGLRVNVKKSRFVSHPSALAVPRDTFPANSLPCQCQWEDKAVFLRKTFQHWEVMDQSTGNKLVQHSIASCNLALQELRPLIKCHFWGEPVRGLQFLNRYVASRFLWYAPLIDPTCNNIQRLRVAQNLAMIHLYKLGIPEDAPFEEAMVLQVLRKRVAYSILDVNRHFSWAHQLLIRKWGYLGHLVRRPCSHLARAALFNGVRDFCSGKIGPWRSHVQWLYQTAVNFFGGVKRAVTPECLTLVEDALTTWAQDRDGWKTAAGRFLQEDLLPHAYVYPTNWTRWQSPYKMNVPWLRSVYLVPASESGHHSDFLAVWVDREEGVMQYRVGEIITDAALADMVSHVAMIAEFICLHLLVSEDLADGYLQVFRRVHYEFLHQGKVVLFEYVPQAFIARVRHLSQ